MFSMSCSALGERTSRYSGDDVRVNGLTASEILARGVRKLVHAPTAVLGPFTAIKLRFALDDGPAKSGDAMLLGLHAADRVANDLSGVAVKPTRHLAFDVVLHLRRQIDVHGHVHKISILWIYGNWNFSVTIQRDMAPQTKLVDPEPAAAQWYALRRPAARTASPCARRNVRLAQCRPSGAGEGLTLRR